MNRRTPWTAGIVAGVAMGVSPALAQAPPLPPAPPAAGSAAQVVTDNDEIRFRGGISAGAGGLSGSGFAAVLGGVDGRLGVQINDQIGVYVQPHLSYGRTPSSTLKKKDSGSLSASVLVDYMFGGGLFVAAGGGLGIWSAPGNTNRSGPELQLRAGGYPILRPGQDGHRRKGLMVGVDLRACFLLGEFGLALQPMASIGYEAF